jgi:hypothetical protein
MVITGYKQSQSVMMIMIKKSLGNIPHDLLPVIGASLLFFDACGQREEIRQQGKSYTVLTNKYCSFINPTSQYLFKISSKFYSVSQKMKTS